MGRFPREYEWRSEIGRLTGIGEAVNTRPLCANLIASKMATLCELQSVYSLEDAFRLDEIARVNSYNAWIASKVK